MSDDTTITAEVVEATPEDIACVLMWLKREYDEDGEGFWCNHTLISDALDRPGDIWVVRRNDEAIAFQLGRYSAAILSVRKDYRNTGMGRVLVQASIARAFRDDVNALSVQCEPEKSLGFWERMGFLQYKDDPCSHIKARLILPRTFVLPASTSAVEVVIGFYPESALYGDARNVRPSAEYHVAGVLADDGSIMLDQRVIGLRNYGRQNGDTVVKIEVDGVVRCFCKGKYENALNAGVQYDDIGDTFFIDYIANELTSSAVAMRLG